MTHKTDMQALAERLRLLLSGDAMLAKTDFARATIEQAIAALAGQSAGVPDGWKLVPIEPTPEMVKAGSTSGGLGMDFHEWMGRINLAWRHILAAAPAPVSEPSPDREQVESTRRVDELSMLIRQLVHALRKAAPDNDLAGRAMDYLKRAGLQGSPLRVEAPDALPFRECGEKKPAGPADQAIYQAIADNYTRESAELGRPLSDFERVVLEYIAFNDGFINTRIRARQMLDGVGGERQGASAPTLGDGKPNLVDRVDDAMRARLGPNYCPPSGEPDNSFLSPVSAAAPQPQAAEPKRQEEQPSFTNPLTPYGMLVRALRIVAGTTLYDMAKALLTTPAKLSAMEFGRAPVTQELAFDVAAYFDALGVPDTLAALTVSANARALLANGE